MGAAVLQDKPGPEHTLHGPQLTQGIPDCWIFLECTSQVLNREIENVSLAVAEKQGPLFSAILLHYSETRFYNTQTW